MVSTGSKNFLDTNLAILRSKLLLFGIALLLSVVSLILSIVAVSKIQYFAIAFIVSSLLSIVSLTVAIRDVYTSYNMLERQKKAEDTVYNLLAKRLPKEYTIYRSLSLGFGDVDLIVVGPKGIFVIEVKSNRGTIYLNESGRIVVKDGDTATMQYRRQVISESNRLKRFLDAETGSKNFVFPVLAFPFATVMRDTYLTNPHDRYKVPILGLNGLVDYIVSQEVTEMKDKELTAINEAMKRISEGKVTFDEQEK